MSKELIERLRNAAIFATSECAWLMTEAADALEAKAAPVGEREAFEAEWKRVIIDEANTPEKHKAFVCFSLGAAYQRAQPQSEYGEAYQGAREDLAIWKRRALEAEARVRQQDQIIDQMGEDLNSINGPTFMGEPVIQQPQSAEAVAFYWQDVGCANPSRHGPYFGWPNDSALRNVDGGAIPVPLYTTPQPSAGVVMPERDWCEDGYPSDDWLYVEGWNACLDEFARLNGKEVGRG